MEREGIEKEEENFTEWRGSRHAASMITKPTIYEV